MEVERGSTVLFAELLGAAELTVRAGDSAAQSAIQRCAGLLVKAAATCDARLVKITGSRVMLVAATTEAGLAAAAAMQSAAEQFSKTADTTLGLGVGLHFGPLLREKGDLFGDTVNFAARMVEQAARGQIVFDAETASALGPFYRGSVRQLYPIAVKGRSAEVTLCELLWRQDIGATLHHHSAALRAPAARLKLKYRGKELELAQSSEPLMIGREGDCGIVVANTHASRHHCSIQRRGDHFVLVDRSTNGTFVTIEGEGETRLKREEFVLRKRGSISLGAPRGANDEAVEFACE